MQRLIRPELDYNLIQSCQYRGDDLEVFYQIINRDNEPLHTFTEEQRLAAHQLWWNSLSPEDRKAWQDYELECQVADECAEQDRWERMIGNY